MLISLVNYRGCPRRPTAVDRSPRKRWPPGCGLANARLARRVRQEALSAGDDLTASRLAALATIDHLGPITLGELAAVEQVQPPSMTRIVARLEETGLAVREVDAHDRRIVRVRITDAGRETIERSRTRKNVFLAQRRRGAHAEAARHARRRAARPRTAARRLMATARGIASTTFRSLRTRNYRLFFVGQGISLCGTWMQTIALGWLVLNLSHNSGVAIGAVIALQFVPTLFLGAWAGVLADRFDKRVLLILTAITMGRHRRRSWRCSRSPASSRSGWCS